MEEKPKLIDDEELEIIDFDDDEVEELPKKEVENHSNLEKEFTIEDIIDIDVNTLEQPHNTQVIQPEINTLNNVESIEETKTIPQRETIGNVITNTEPSIEEPVKEEIKQENNTQQVYVNEQVFNVDNKIVNEKKEEKTEKVKSGKSIFVGILIFVILIGAIFSLPFLNEYVNKKTRENYNQNNFNSNTNNTSKEFKSNIDITNTLNTIKEYRNYKYQNINDIYTKDNQNQPLSIKNSYSYLFNETKFGIEINKTVADFSYETKDYYEKLDEKYNLYINDITTKTYSVKDTTVDEFNNIYNMYPKMLDYLISNYKLVSEKQVKVENKQHINITLKVSKEILNNLLIETNRIQNKFDVSKLTIEFIEVDLLFNENKKLYKIEFSIEDKFAYQEELDGEVESAMIKYVFTDFNKIEDIKLPEL